MAIIDQNALMRRKDSNGNEYLLYPITKIDCVDGAEGLVHFDKEQELTADQKAQFLKNIGGLCSPNNAAVNKFLKISAVDDNGNVTAVEAADVAIDSSSGGSVNPDYNQNDSTKSDYIKNRPFYTGTPVIDKQVLLDTTNIKMDSSTWYSQSANTNVELSAGKEYTVTFDDVDYIYMAQDAINDYYGPCVIIGNPMLFSLSNAPEDDNGCPFMVMWSTAFNMLAIKTTDTSFPVEHTIKIVNNIEIPVINKMDSKYLPNIVMDNLCYTEGKENELVYFYNSSVPFSESTDSYYDGAFISFIDITEETYNSWCFHNGSILVNWDGVDYNTSMQVYRALRYIGDPSIFDEAKNDMPFTIWAEFNDASAEVTYKIVMVTRNTSEKHSVKIVFDPAIVHKLDEKYLPDVVMDNLCYSESITEDILSNQTIEGFSPMQALGLSFYTKLDTFRFELIKDQEYKVLWDGEEYLLTAFEFVSPIDGLTVIALGNTIVANGIDNNIPLMITYLPDTFNNQYYSFEEATSHTVSIVHEYEAAHKLDEKYLPDVVMDNLCYTENEGVKGQIVDVTSQNFTLNDDDTSFPGMYSTLMPISKENYDLWNSCNSTAMVTWDGIDYCSKMQLIPADSEFFGLKALGNMSIFGGTDNGDPFTVVVDFWPGDNTEDDTYVIVIVTADNSETHSIKVVLDMSVVHKLDEKYLPDVVMDNLCYSEFITEELSSEQTIDGFTLMEAFGLSFYIAQTSVPYKIFKDQTYRIKWDGREYVETAFESQGASGNTLVGIGNKLLAGEENNGVPFGMMYDPSTSVVEYYSFEEATSHTVSIVHEYEEVHKLKEKYLPMDAIKAYIDDYIGTALGGDY